MSWFLRRVDNSPRTWPYGLRCAACDRPFVGGTIREPVYERLDFWASLRVLMLVWIPVCEDCR